MTLQEAFNRLITDIENVRNLQKQYFQTRDKNILAESKRAEKELDNVVYNLKQLHKN